MRGKIEIDRPYRDLGKLLKVARERAGFTQKEVSDRLGYTSGQMVSNAERGLTTFPYSKMRAVMTLYKIQMEDVVEQVMRGHETLLKDALLRRDGRRR